MYCDQLLVTTHTHKIFFEASPWVKVISANPLDSSRTGIRNLFGEWARKPTVTEAWNLMSQLVQQGESGPVYETNVSTYTMVRVLEPLYLLSSHS